MTIRFVNVNPRSHEGRDDWAEIPEIIFDDVNPRSHKESDSGK
ncbi:hypothetical protein [Streptococcus equi]|nr:hypothetical protein [Streptococcus equi]